MATLEIDCRTLTPLWTGGVNQRPDPVHETGLIGSLRWWYEALVRGLGGYACDPTDEEHKCREYSPTAGRKSVCAACYLFGATGWARLFRLQAFGDGLQREPLHFYATLRANKHWLGSVFGGEAVGNRVDGITVPFGRLRLAMVGRGEDEEYALGQIAWTLQFAAREGGIGAKLQHGFGQVALKGDLSSITRQSEDALARSLTQFRQGKNQRHWPSRADFFVLRYHVADDHPILAAIREARYRIGHESRNASQYIPCVFDLRYKGDIGGKQLGLRQWLLDRGWNREDIEALLGVTRARRDEERTGSRLFMGMPYSRDQGYVIKIFGFAPPHLEVGRIKSEVDAYMHAIWA